MYLLNLTSNEGMSLVKKNCDSAHNLWRHILMLRKKLKLLIIQLLCTLLLEFMFFALVDPINWYGKLLN